MRIALLTDAWKPQVNGVVTALTALVRELEAAGHDVLVIHPGLFVTVPCPTYTEIRLAAAPPGDHHTVFCAASNSRVSSASFSGRAADKSRRSSMSAVRLNRQPVGGQLKGLELS